MSTSAMRPLTAEELMKLKEIRYIINEPEIVVKRKMRNRIEYVCPACKTVLDKHVERCKCGKKLLWYGDKPKQKSGMMQNSFQKKW